MVEANHLTTTHFSDTITIGGFHIVNVYKPPSANWDLQALPTLLSMWGTLTTLTGDTQWWIAMVRHFQTGHPEMTLF